MCNRFCALTDGRSVVYGCPWHMLNVDYSPCSHFHHQMSQSLLQPPLKGCHWPPDVGTSVPLCSPCHTVTFFALLACHILCITRRTWTGILCQGPFCILIVSIVLWVVVENFHHCQPCEMFQNMLWLVMKLVNVRCDTTCIPSITQLSTLNIQVLKYIHVYHCKLQDGMMNSIQYC